jgi:hypothetical protein
MTSNYNPFASWATSSDGQSSQDSTAPSIMGALPYINLTYPLAPDNITTFNFTSFNPTILNCTVLGEHNRPVFHVSTDDSMPGYSVLKDVKTSNIALIEWQSSPLLEVRGILSKQKITDWLKLSSDRRLVMSFLVLFAVSHFFLIT